jgi:hypothetical protein
MSEKILKAEYRGEVVIGASVIPCAVLEDGTRIISENGIFSNLGTSGGSVRKLRDEMQKNRQAPLPLFLASKALEPFIDKVFNSNHLTPIKYLNNDKIMVGYPADILPKVCDVWLMARESKTLQPSQLPKAKKAEILMRGLAHIGITALVDEVTGYQYKRDKDDLQVILGAYISEKIAEWQLTFTEDFYDEIFRLWKQTYNKQKQKRPAFFGHLTNKYIYEPIKGGVVLDDIKQKASDDDNKAKFHQYLTEDIGREHLKRQIIEITALMSICNTKEEFIEIFKKKYLKDYQHSMFSSVPIIASDKKGSQPKELDLIAKTVVNHKIDPDEPLPNNTFKKS